jgi:hypothetical protein
MTVCFCIIQLNSFRVGMKVLRVFSAICMSKYMFILLVLRMNWNLLKNFTRCDLKKVYNYKMLQRLPILYHADITHYSTCSMVHVLR